MLHILHKLQGSLFYIFAHLHQIYRLLLVKHYFLQGHIRFLTEYIAQFRSNQISIGHLSQADQANQATKGSLLAIQAEWCVCSIQYIQVLIYKIHDRGVTEGDSDQNRLKRCIWHHLGPRSVFFFLSPCNFSMLTNILKYMQNAIYEICDIGVMEGVYNENGPKRCVWCHLCRK